MPPPERNGRPDLAAKIARLVEERGWNQEDLVRQSGLNRQTVRRIMLALDDSRLRNATVGACAKALGLSVRELREEPLDALLPRMDCRLDVPAEESLRRLHEQATQPKLIEWLDRHPDRAAQLQTHEIDELLSLQGVGGPLTEQGVERFVELIERKRTLIEKVHAVAGTEYVDMLEKFVDLLYDKVRPYGDRG